MNLDVIFYHIEKCAGTSIRKFLYDFFKEIYSKEQLLIIGYGCAIGKYADVQKLLCNNKNGWNQINEKYGKDFFLNIKVLACHMNFISNIQPKLSIICVRDPISRLISHYVAFDKKIYDNKRLDEFSEFELQQYCLSIGNVMTYRLSGGNGNLTDAIINIQKIDIILIYEMFDLSFENLTHHLIKKYHMENLYIPTISIENSNSEKDKYSTEFLNKLRKYCVNDYEIYKYCIDLFNMKFYGGYLNNFPLELNQ